MIENPQPAALVLLLLALPGIAALAMALGRRLASTKDLGWVMVPGIFVTLALLPVHFLARYFGGLASGLVVSWGALGAVGYALLLRRGASPSVAGAFAPIRRRSMAIAAFVAVGLIVPATMFYDFHDERLFGGHQAMIAHLQNGTYPPRFLYAPAYELRYHYAFDLAAAVLTLVTRLRVDQAIDVLTLSLWGYTFVLLWCVGDRLVARGAGPFVAVVTALAGTVCYSGGWRFFGLAHPLCDFRDGGCANPPFLSYFFQHPWALGTPLFLVAILVYDSVSSTPAASAKPLSYAVLLLCLLTLFLSQIVLFMMLMFGIGISEGWQLIRNKRRASVYVLSTLLVTGLVALQSGGFMTKAPFAAKVGLLGSGFLWAPLSIGDSVTAHVRWHVASFGLLLPVGIAGLLQLRRQRMLLSLIAGGSLGVLSMFTFARSWDIAKFGTVVALCLGIGAGAQLYAWWQRSARAHSRAAVAAVAVALCGSGFAFITEYWHLAATDRIEPYWTLAYPVKPAEAAAISFLRKRVAPSEMVYRRVPQARAFARWGGLSTVWSDEYADAFGFDAARIEARRADLSTMTEDYLERLAKWQVSWVVVDETEPFLAGQLTDATRTGRSELVATFGNIRVYRLQLAG